MMLGGAGTSVNGTRGTGVDNGAGGTGINGSTGTASESSTRQVTYISKSSYVLKTF